MREKQTAEGRGIHKLMKLSVPLAKLIGKEMESRPQVRTSDIYGRSLISFFPTRVFHEFSFTRREAHAEATTAC